MNEINDDSGKNWDQEFEKLRLEEENIKKQLDTVIIDVEQLEGSLVDLLNVNENIYLLNNDAKQLTTILKNSSTLSTKINVQIQELDIARSRVSECQKRVQDLLDLQLCSDGVQNALKEENYEQAAIHIHRFLAMDQHLLKQTADDMAQDCATVTQSLKLLRDAAAMLRNKISLHFKEAISVSDLESVKRFFKLFPLLNMHDYGLETFSSLLRKMLKNAVTEKLNSIKTNNILDKRNSIVFADVITFLFEEIARLISDNKPLIETYYGSGSLITVVSALQKECDFLSELIINEFRSCRNITPKIHIINEVTRSGSSKTEHIEPKEIDLLLNEITMIHSRYGLYLRFVRARIQEDLEGNASDPEKSKNILTNLDSIMLNSNLAKQMQTLIGDYLLLERYYVEQSIKKALTMDTFDKDALVSSMVDDMFFIVKKSIRRGYSSGNIDAVCAIINNACTILETDVCNTLRQQLRQGYSAGYLDLTQAYNVMIQGRLQQMDSEQNRVLFLLYLNNCDVCTEYTSTLQSTLAEEIKCSTHNEKAKLDSCLSGFASVKEAFAHVKEYGLLQLKNSVVKPRVVPWVDNFLTVSHQLSFEEFSSYDANEPFIRSLIINLESLLSEFKPRLTPTNYDHFIVIIAEEVIIQLEKDILKTDFNRVGGLILDKEIRSLVSYMSNATLWSIREKFSRLTQIALVLNLEKVTEILEYWGSENCTFTWRLTPKEIKQFLSLRKDFRSEDIKRLKL
ncbi:hypothetical protein V9T40_011121 [Parthenolecanium corni]|uniref:Conserved oligomeric Golgi complex subunit 4 n=1 Tax=Parthenolecanium corni TaxID=536013 RepID=A0AAN9T5G2_9HEMI